MPSVSFYRSAGQYRQRKVAQGEQFVQLYKALGAGGRLSNRRPFGASAGHRRRV